MAKNLETEIKFKAYNLRSQKSLKSEKQSGLENEPKLEKICASSSLSEEINTIKDRDSAHLQKTFKEISLLTNSKDIDKNNTQKNSL